MKTLFLLPFIIFSLTANATNYYISSSGNDANNGTSTSTSWQTIAKINSSTFSAGDEILFNDGGTWFGPLIVPSNGTSTSLPSTTTGSALTGTGNCIAFILY